MEKLEETGMERGPGQKYCRDCGKIIMDRAEICPICGCRQIGVPPVESQMKASEPSIPLRTEAIRGVMFSAGVLFVLHFYFVAQSHTAVFASVGYLFVLWIEYLVLGTLMGTILWTGTGLLGSAIGARDPKVLLIARGVIQGALLVPIAAYSERSDLDATTSFGIAALFALIGGGYAFWLSRSLGLRS